MIEQFNKFWGEYPRKVAKGNARKAFQKALKLATFEEIMQGLENSKMFWSQNETEKQYIPHGASWLNGERWEDELELDLTYLNSKPYDKWTDDEWGFKLGQENPSEYMIKYMPAHIKEKFGIGEVVNIKQNLTG